MTSTAAIESVTASPRRSSPGAVLAVLGLSTFAIIVMQSMVMPSLPEICDELGITLSEGSWMVTANLLSAAVFTPLFGSLGDALGRKKILLVVLALTFVGALMTAMASGLTMALAGRVLQGPGMAVMPLAIGIMREISPPEKVPGAVSVISALTGVGAGAGLLISGLMLKAGMTGLGMFWIATVVLLAGLIGDAKLIHLPPHKQEAFKLDTWGVLTLSGGLVSLTLGINRGPDWGWASASVLGLFAAAVLLMVAWYAAEMRAEQPLVDLTTIKHPVVLVSNLTALVLGIGMYGVFVLILQFVQTPAEAGGYGFDVDALGGGLTLLPLTLGTLIAAAMVSPMVKRVGPKWPLVLGCGVSTMTYVFLFFFHGSHLDFYIASGLMGMGLGLAMGSMPTLLNNSVAPEQTSAVNGFNGTVRSIGGSIGTVMVAAILAGYMVDDIGTTSLEGFKVAFVAAGAICLLATVVATLMPYRHTSTPKQSAPHATSARV